MKTRIVNIRSIFVSFVALVVGVFCFMYFASFGYGGVNFTVFTALFFAIAFMLIAFYFLVKFLKTRYKFFAVVNANKKHILLVAIFLVIGFLVMFANYNYYNYSYTSFEGEYLISGEVDDNVFDSGKYTMVTLSNVVVSNSEGDFKLKGKATFFIFSSGIADTLGIAGDSRVQFVGTVEKTEFSLHGYNLSRYANNTVYQLTKTSDDYSFLGSQFDVDEAIRNYYKQVIKNKAPAEIANISYSLLFGNDEVLSSEVMDLFSVTGVVHIISVSGLHVAVLVAAFVVLLKALRVPRAWQFVVLFVALAFYCYLCGLVPSVIRSAIMSLVFLASINLGERYDALSSLSLSGLLILLASPVQLFTLGFQLSFISVFGLFTFTPVISNLFKKIKIPNAVGLPIALTLGATIATFPIISSSFGELATYSVVANLLVVPIMSFAYIFIFAVVSVSVILPFVSGLLLISNVLLHFSSFLLNIINTLPNATISFISDGYLSLIIVLLLGFVLRFVAVNFKAKTAIATGLVAIVVASLIITNTPKTYNYYSAHAQYHTNSSVVMFTTKSGDNVLVAQTLRDFNHINKIKQSMKIGKVSAIVIFGFEQEYATVLAESANMLSANRIVVYANESEFSQTTKNKFIGKDFMVMQDELQIDLFGLKISAIYDFNMVLALNVVVGNESALLVNNKLSKNQTLSLYLAVEDSLFDVVFLSNWKYEDLPIFNSKNFVWQVGEQGFSSNANHAVLKQDEYFTYAF